MAWETIRVPRVNSYLDADDEIPSAKEDEK
jgi:hypothetical protein